MITCNVIARTASLALLTLPLAAQSTIRVSVGPSGAESNGHSQRPSISADGRCVAFHSTATNLTAGTHPFGNVYVHDRRTGTTEIASVDSAGADGNGQSYDTLISADGRCVGFISLASNFAATDTNGVEDVFVHDRVTGVTECVSVTPGGTTGNGQSLHFALSADGRFIAFGSYASDLVAGDVNGFEDIFVRDRQLGTTERVSVDASGTAGNGVSHFPWLSDDARYVAFGSRATNLVPGDTNGFEDVFLRDRLLGTTERLSVGPGGAQANQWSSWVSLSPDGRFATFVSDATNLAPGDVQSFHDAFLRDRLSATTECLSLNPSGVTGNGDVSLLPPSISADGRYVSFESTANDLVANDVFPYDDVFLRDRQTGTTELAGLTTSGAQPGFHAFSPSISGTGRYVAFESPAPNLVAGDTNTAYDVFVRDRLPSFTPFCFGDGLDTAHTSACPCGNTGAPGNGCANSAVAGGANLAASGATEIDTAQLAGSAMPATSLCIYLQGDALDDATFGDGVRCTGGSLLRLRARANVAGASTFPDSTDTVTLSARGGVAPFSGERREYQTYYRNAAAAFCPPETFNVTNGVIIDW